MKNQPAGEMTQLHRVLVLAGAIGILLWGTTRLADGPTWLQGVGAALGVCWLAAFVLEVWERRRRDPS
jgi:hypothetical protein